MFEIISKYGNQEVFILTSYFSFHLLNFTPIEYWFYVKKKYIYSFQLGR